MKLFIPKTALLLPVMICSFRFITGDTSLNQTKEAKLLKDLKDVYAAFDINHKINDQKELIGIYNDDSGPELSKFLNNSIRVCDSLKQVSFFNDTLKGSIGNFLAATIQNYKIAGSYGVASAVFKKDVKSNNAVNSKYMDYLLKTYPMERFVKLSEKEYWQIIDRKNYVKSADYATYQKLKKTNLKAALTLLEKIAGQTKNFQEYSIYEIEMADQYVKHADKLGTGATGIAIKKYKSILDKKEYSIYLFESWLKWRTVSQQNNGLSKTSDIPNNLYDKVRKEISLTILNNIKNNPKDKMAINQFLDIATHDIVRRFGDYPHGNQNTVEYHEIFDEKK